MLKTIIKQFIRTRSKEDQFSMARKTLTLGIEVVPELGFNTHLLVTKLKFITHKEQCTDLTRNAQISPQRTGPHHSVSLQAVLVPVIKIPQNKLTGNSS